MDLEIPNGDLLFRFVKPTALPEDQDEVPHGLFEDQELSCDWKKYREDPLTSFQIDIGNSAVIEITVDEEIKQPTNPKRLGIKVPEWRQEVIYNPELSDSKGRENLAHSLIKGKKKLAVQAIIAKFSRRWIP